jgi:hypothetical protein
VGPEVRLLLPSGDAASVTVVRWDLAAFDVKGLQIQHGHFVTLQWRSPGQELTLAQHSTTFYTSRDDPRVHALTAAEVRGAGAKPQWHRRSDRWWPCIGEKPLPFLTQYETVDHVGYVFGSLSSDELVAVFLDPRTGQDVEDHYDDEEP